MINLPDLINASFEFFCGFFILNHCRVILKDKSVKGVSIISTIFFTLWGFWNCFYYPYLDQYLSFIGGIVIAFANAFYVYLLIKYYKNEKSSYVCTECPRDDSYIKKIEQNIERIMREW